MADTTTTGGGASTATGVAAGIQGLIYRIQLIVAPQTDKVKTAADDLGKFVKQNKELEGVWNELRYVGNTLWGGLSKAFDVQNQAWGKNIENFKEIGKASTNVAQKFAGLADLMLTQVSASWRMVGLQWETAAALLKGPLVSGIVTVTVGVAALSAAMYAYAKILMEAGSAATRFAANQKEVQLMMVQSGQSTEKFYAAVNEAQRRGAIASLGKEFGGLVQFMESFSNVTDAVLGRIVSLTAGFGKWLNSFNPFGKTLSDLTNYLNDLTEAMQKTSASAADIKFSVSEDAGKNIGAITEQLHAMAENSGVDFGVLFAQFNKIKNVTGDTRAAILGIETAYKLASETGFKNSTAWFNAIAKVQTGTALTEEELRGFGYTVAKDGVEILKADKQLELFTDRLKRLGVASAEVGQIKIGITTGESLIGGLRKDLELRRSMNTLTVEEERKTMEIIAGIDIGSVEQKKANYRDMIDSQAKNVERIKSLELGRVEAAVTANASLFGDQLESLSALSRLHKDFWKTSIDLTKENADITKQKSAEAMQSMVADYGRLLAVSKNVFNSIASARDTALQAGAAANLGLSVDRIDKYIGKEKSRLEIMSAQAAVAKNEASVLKEQDQTGIKYYAKLVEINQKYVEGYQLAKATREAMQQLLTTTADLGRAIELAQGAGVIDQLKLEKQAFDQRIKFIKDQLAQEKLSNTERAALLVSQANLQLDHYNKTNEQYKRLGAAGLSAFQIGTVELRKQTIFQDQLLSKLAAGKVNALNPDELTKVLVRNQGSTFATKALEVVSAQQIGKFLKDNNDSVTEIKRALAGGGIAAAASSFQRLTVGMNDTQIKLIGDQLLDPLEKAMNPETKQLVDLNKSMKELQDINNDVKKSYRAAFEEEQKFRAEVLASVKTLDKIVPGIPLALDWVVLYQKALYKELETANKELLKVPGAIGAFEASLIPGMWNVGRAVTEAFKRMQETKEKTVGGMENTEEKAQKIRSLQVPMQESFGKEFTGVLSNMLADIVKSRAGEGPTQQRESAFMEELRNRLPLAMNEALSKVSAKYGENAGEAMKPQDIEDAIKKGLSAAFNVNYRELMSGTGMENSSRPENPPLSGKEVKDLIAAGMGLFGASRREMGHNTGEQPLTGTITPVEHPDANKQRGGYGPETMAKHAEEINESLKKIVGGMQSGGGGNIGSVLTQFFLNALAGNLNDARRQNSSS